jgi:hypothetical protein
MIAGASSSKQRPCAAGQRLITANERGWIEFIRLVSNDTDPPPTLERVQALRRIFMPPSGARLAE